MNGQFNKEETAGTVYNASLPFLKSDECECIKGHVYLCVGSVLMTHIIWLTRGQTLV